MSGAQRKLCAVKLNNTLNQFRIARSRPTVSFGRGAAARRCVSYTLNVVKANRELVKPVLHQQMKWLVVFS